MRCNMVTRCGPVAPIRRSSPRVPIITDRNGKGLNSNTFSRQKSRSRELHMPTPKPSASSSPLPQSVRRPDQMTLQTTLAAGVSRPGRSAALAPRTDRDDPAGAADRADAARPGRDDDDRPGAAGAARRSASSRRPRSPYRAVRRFRAGDGPCFRCGAAGGASLRRAQSARGAPCVARRPLGRDPARRAAQLRAILRPGHPACTRTERTGGDAGGALSLRSRPGA